MRFSRDRRGQSVVVGTVILFGFLILALSLYQVQIVPQQNAEVEFQHFEEVRNDLVELRASTLEEGSSDRPKYETVRLGTTYPTRIFAINPPAPAGTIQTTSRSYNITIDPESADPINVSTRFLQYRPGYNEIDASSTWYDASVLYVDATDRGGGIAVIEDQALVENGDVQIVALQNEFRRSGTGRVTVELHSAENTIEQLPEGNVTVTVPTRLNGSEYWNTEANISSDVYGGVTSDNNDDGVHNLTLETTASNLTVDTVGIQQAPEESIQKDDKDGSNPGNGSDFDRVYNVSWNDPGLLSIGSNRLNGTVESDGEPLDSATVDFATNSSIAIFQDTSATTTNGNFTTNVTTTQGGTATLFAASGDDVDQIQVEIVEVPGTMAERTAIVDSNSESFGTSNSELRFTIENTGTENVIISGIRVDSSSRNNVDHISGTPTFRDTGGQVFFENRINFGDQVDINDIDIDGSNDIRVELGEFRQQSGPNSKIRSMAGESVDITLFFDDGSSAQFTVST
ncbi:hypothetical protein [Halorubrum yunnanense]|uniref:CARDB domain-containing protein n=1 Tax=Halorubrum yunnanense TaxID=1526162 RepID=A0ABD5YD82_9EURY|nr:hypothetical protein [Halorubrum yunnanense]